MLNVYNGKAKLVAKAETLNEIREAVACPQHKKLAAFLKAKGMMLVKDSDGMVVRKRHTRSN